MAKITYVPYELGGEPLSWELLAKISDCTVEEYKADHQRQWGHYGFECRPFADNAICPFGERDLMHDTCYIGSDVHRCKYFRRYVHEGEHKGTIECCCPKPRVVAEKGKVIQLSLFDF